MILVYEPGIGYYKLPMIYLNLVQKCFEEYTNRDNLEDFPNHDKLDELLKEQDKLVNLTLIEIDDCKYLFLYYDF